PREGEGDRRRPLRHLADPDQHARGRAQRQSRAARGGEVVPLERAAPLAARDRAVHSPVHDDGAATVDRALPRRHDRGRVPALVERPRRPDHPQHRALPDRQCARGRALPDRQCARGRAHDHGARHGPDRDRAGARELLRTLAGGRMTAVAVRTRTPRTFALSPRAEALLLRVAAGVVLLGLWEGLVTWLSPYYVTRPSGVAKVFWEVVSNRPTPLTQLSGSFWFDVQTTIVAVFEGLAIGVGAGVIVGLAMGRLRDVEWAL